MTRYAQWPKHWQHAANGALLLGASALVLAMSFGVLLIPGGGARRGGRAVPMREDLFQGLRLSSAEMPGAPWATVEKAWTERRRLGFLAMGFAPVLVLEHLTLTLPEAEPEAGTPEAASPTPFSLGTLTGSQATSRRQRYGSVRIQGLVMRWRRGQASVPFLRASGATLQLGEEPGLALARAHFAERPNAWEPLQRARIVKAGDTLCLTALRRDGRALRVPLPLTF